MQSLVHQISGLGIHLLPIVAGVLFMLGAESFDAGMAWWSVAWFAHEAGDYARLWRQQMRSERQTIEILERAVHCAQAWQRAWNEKTGENRPINNPPTL